MDDKTLYWSESAQIPRHVSHSSVPSLLLYINGTCQAPMLEWYLTTRVKIPRTALFDNTPLRAPWCHVKPGPACRDAIPSSCCKGLGPKDRSYNELGCAMRKSARACDDGSCRLQFMQCLNTIPNAMIPGCCKGNCATDTHVHVLQLCPGGNPLRKRRSQETVNRQ